MATLKHFAKQLPLLPSAYRMLRKRYFRYQSKSNDTEQVFTDIYRSNAWGGTDSVSGTGSDAYQTRLLIKELPIVFREFGISTILDIPCGDFHWMKNVDLTDVAYTGADIVTDLIESNTVKYTRAGVSFKAIDITNDMLPKVDLIFCRDCLVHLAFEDCFRALENLSNSQSEYLLTTTFTRLTGNHNIRAGQWRVLNLELPPFELPRPIKLINEGCTEGNGAYIDKSLGLWRADDIRQRLAARRA